MQIFLLSYPHETREIPVHGGSGRLFRGGPGRSRSAGFFPKARVFENGEIALLILHERKHGRLKGSAIMELPILCGLWEELGLWKSLERV